MKELLINQIAPIAATAIVAILVAIIKSIGGAAIELFVAKKKEAELKIKASGHEEEVKTAKEVWHIVEEKFRITENVAQILSSKADEFDKLLLQRIPGLSAQNLEDLRQAVAGEFNKDKEAVLNQTDALKQLQDTNALLQAENAEIKNQLSQVQSVVSVNTITQETSTASTVQA